MAKKRANKNQRGFGKSTGVSKRDLAVIHKYIGQERMDKALAKFKTLDLVSPVEDDVMQLGVALAYEESDWTYTLQLGLQWQKNSPNSPEPYQVLGNAYLQNDFPFLCLKTCRQFLEKFPNHEAANDIQELAKDITPMTEAFLKDANFSAEHIPLMWLHEMSQAVMEQGKYEQAISIIQDLIKQAPNFIPPYNNLSIIYSLQERWQQAIDTIETALEKQPDHYYTLSNGAQFSFLKGDEDLARNYAKKLQDIPNQSLEGLYMYKAETFSLLRDDQIVIELGEEATKDTNLDCDPLFWHWVAVAYANQDNWQKAKEIWQELLPDSESERLINKNLENAKRSLGQRNSPWAFDLTQWIREEIVDELVKLADILKISSKESAIATFLERNARIISLVPFMLDRGCPTTKKFALYAIQLSEDATLLEYLKDFALGERGSDQERIEALQIVMNAGLIPSGFTKMWIEGEWRERLSMNLEITDKPIIKHSRKVMPMVQKVIRLLKAEEGEEAEKIIQQALELEPNAPDLWHNLAVAYQVQGREQEARDLVAKVHQDYPDYSFATLSIARHCIEEGDLDRAEELLKTFFNERKMHYLAFVQLCEGNIELALARKNYDGAQTWLDMWEEIDPESEQLSYWQRKVTKKIDWF